MAKWGDTPTGGSNSPTGADIARANGTDRRSRDRDVPSGLPFSVAPGAWDNSGASGTQAPFGSGPAGYGSSRDSGGGQGPVHAFAVGSAPQSGAGIIPSGTSRATPFGSIMMVQDAYPLGGANAGMAMREGPGVGYGLRDADGYGTIFTAADRSFGDYIHPESWAPGRHHNQFSVYNPDSGEFDSTAGFSATEAGAAVGNNVFVPFPLSLATGPVLGAAARAIDPPHPVGVDVIRGIEDATPYSAPLADGWNAPTERDTWDNARARMYDSPWGAPITPPDPGADGPDSGEAPEAPAPPETGLEYTPYGGDYARYGFGPEHLFLRRRSALA